MEQRQIACKARKENRWNMKSNIALKILHACQKANERSEAATVVTCRPLKCHRREIESRVRCVCGGGGCRRSHNDTNHIFHVRVRNVVNSLTLKTNTSSSVTPVNAPHAVRTTGPFSAGRDVVRAVVVPAGFPEVSSVLASTPIEGDVGATSGALVTSLRLSWLARAWR